MSNRLLRILIVEDHASTGEILARTLARRGHTVSYAENGEKALTFAQSQTFDLLISDIGLPDTDGWELFTQLRGKQPQMHAIALTGYGYASDIERSAAVGFEIHLTKPADWPAIDKAIATLFPN